MSIFNGLSSYPNTFSEKINPKSEALFSTTLTLEHRGPQPQDFELNFQANFGKAVAVGGGGSMGTSVRAFYIIC